MPFGEEELVELPHAPTAAAPRTRLEAARLEVGEIGANARRVDR